MKFNKIYDKIILEFGSCEYAGTDKCTENDKEYWDSTDYAIFLNMLKEFKKVSVEKLKNEYNNNRDFVEDIKKFIAEVEVKLPSVSKYYKQEDNWLPILHDDIVQLEAGNVSIKDVITALV